MEKLIYIARVWNNIFSSRLDITLAAASCNLLPADHINTYMDEFGQVNILKPESSWKFTLWQYRVFETFDQYFEVGIGEIRYWRSLKEQNSLKGY